MGIACTTPTTETCDNMRNSLIKTFLWRMAIVTQGRSMAGMS